VGSVLQLVPTEVMVKREKGFYAATRDWEFFELDVSPAGSTIRTRGFVSVVNRCDGNCFTTSEPVQNGILCVVRRTDAIPFQSPSP